MSVSYTIDGDLKTIEGLDKPGSTGDIRSIVNPNGRVGEGRDGFLFQEVIEYPTGVVRNIRRLKFVMILAKDIVHARLHMQGVEIILSVEIGLACFV